MMCRTHMCLLSLPLGRQTHVLDARDAWGPSPERTHTGRSLFRTFGAARVRAPICGFFSSSGVDHGALVGLRALVFGVSSRLSLTRSGCLQPLSSSFEGGMVTDSVTFEQKHRVLHGAAVSQTTDCSATAKAFPDHRQHGDHADVGSSRENDSWGNVARGNGTFAATAAHQDFRESSPILAADLHATSLGVRGEVSTRCETSTVEAPGRERANPLGGGHARLLTGPTSEAVR